MSTPFVSTGQLPPAEVVGQLVSAAYARYRHEREGANSDVYPALARAAGDLFGICAVSTSGEVAAAGDADVEFSIMSVSKPFVFALVCQVVGAEEARERLGANATGLPFNSRAAVEQSADGRTNPMVNPGAIATTSLVPGASGVEKWTFISEGLSRFAGRALALDEEVYASASATNHVNQELAHLLERAGRIYWEAAEAVDLYTRQCSLAVSARDLAVMGATLADGGVNPVTSERVVDAETCRYALAVMTTAGLYETSGDWLYDIGLAGKERHRRRNRHRRARQGRARHVLTPARRCGQQRQGSARCEVPLPAPGNGSLRVEPRGVIGTTSLARSGLIGVLVAAALAFPALAQRRSRGRDGACREVRAGRADRRAGAGVWLRREVRPDRRRPPVRRADRGLARALERHRPGQDRPCRRRSRQSLRLSPRLPGLDARTGLRLRALDEAAHRGKRSHGVRPRRERALRAREARSPVLALLHLQRVQQPARRRLGDDPAQLRRCRCGRSDRRGARHGRLQLPRGRRARRLGRGQARAGRQHASRRLPGFRLARQQVHRGAVHRQLGGGRCGLRRHARPASRAPPGRQDDPERR